VKRLNWSAAPPDATPVQRKNFINVQNDAVGVGLANAAAQFLSVFLTRLGATSFQVGLLTSMPAFTGLLIAIPVGRFLQSRRKIVPWFSGSRLLVISSYALTGIVPFIFPEKWIIPIILLIWMVATIPQIVLNVTFSVVMNAVAGPTKRYDLMSRRWSILGLTTAITVALTGQVLVRIDFPINYQLVFISLSLGGLISFYFSSHIQIPDVEPSPPETGSQDRSRIKAYWSLISHYPDFLSFTAKRFVYLFGFALAVPLFPLYYVRSVDAPDSWIGFINTAQTAVLLVGYFYWTRQSRSRGSRFVLLWTTFGLALYPALVASTKNIQVIVILAGFAGIFQAGIDLVFFDELMKTVPIEYSATFVSFAQGVQYSSALVAPLLGTFLADQIGIEGALMISAGVRMIGFILFAVGKKKTTDVSELNST
jgi:hypothetical protein